MRLAAAFEGEYRTFCTADQKKIDHAAGEKGASFQSIDNLSAEEEPFIQFLEPVRAAN